jgi:hypothetical protein
MSTQHPRTSELRSFVDDRLGEEQVEQILAHIEVCDACLEAVDQMWSDRWDRAVLADEAPTSESARRVERRLLQRMHILTMMRQTARLVFLGPPRLILGFMRPMQKPNAALQPEEGTDGHPNAQ